MKSPRDTRLSKWEDAGNLSPGPRREVLAGDGLGGQHRMGYDGPEHEPQKRVVEPHASGKEA